MALREFTDHAGVAWRVWDITPESTHRATRLEDYLQGFLDGWLVFETIAGTEKRRLYPLPAHWEAVADDELENLLQKAAPVGRMEAAGDADSLEGETLRRTFSYPGGAAWTVAETPVVFRDGEGRPVETLTVLRFSSGTRHLDLLAWPRNWPRRSDEELAELLWRAFPRARALPGGEERTTEPRPARRRGESRLR